MKEESLLLLSDLQKLINQVVLIDYTIIILGGTIMRAIELFEELESIYFDYRIFKTSFGNPLTFVRDDSIKAYVLKREIQ